MSGPTRTAAPERGLLLHLAGPLQSWGERSHFNERDTARFPTRSGVMGLLAAALGRSRGEPLGDLTRLSLTVRTDRPGVLLNDLHTVGGGLPSRETVTTAEGKKRPGDTGTLLTHRAYLADAAFTVALTSADPSDRGTISACAEALREPQWPPFLGRRSCPPEGPLLIGETDDALRHLLHLPLAAPRPSRAAAGTEFLSDQALDRLPVSVGVSGAEADLGTQASGNVQDEPLSFHPRSRSHRVRDLYRRTVLLPPGQHAGLGTTHLEALGAYLAAHPLNHPEGSML
ncbi:type I-E CRISPR-associated protein Cas5/CasD [Actinacidiphila bryophytorum]|uniref:type I-E CRISPR-associated protein Cas5/CasD n=1 Tax=Actinacidiphila bryophytorum TaxID=1436133 RepID=UPI002176D4EB|nr:type I-E CRISPR-associated protein Cas5/CasD [Actinacidiphila bryophytorum]UWE08713.1 type I-E CRISPR-associated protein Cas5/CasD [Actinacidiphila bryophytorum]